MSIETASGSPMRQVRHEDRASLIGVNGLFWRRKICGEIAFPMAFHLSAEEVG